MNIKYAIFAQGSDGKLVRTYNDQTFDSEDEAWSYANSMLGYDGNRIYTVLPILM